jgi:hypothetical protein
VGGFETTLGGSGVISGILIEKQISGSTPIAQNSVRGKKDVRTDFLDLLHGTTHAID